MEHLRHAGSTLTPLTQHRTQATPLGTRRCIQQPQGNRQREQTEETKAASPTPKTSLWKVSPRKLVVRYSGALPGRPPSVNTPYSYPFRDPMPLQIPFPIATLQNRSAVHLAKSAAKTSQAHPWRSRSFHPPRPHRGLTKIQRGASRLRDTRILNTHGIT